MFQKILNLLNIKPDSNQKWILLSYAVTYTLFGFISPALTQALYTSLPTRWFSFSSLVGSVSGLAVGIIWRGKFRDVMIRRFTMFCICECLIGAALGFYMAFFNQNMWIYAVTSLVYTNLITIAVMKCVMAFKSKLWNEREREIYDNNQANTAYITMIIGYLLGLIYVPPIRLALFLFGVICLFDDAGWIYVYIKNRQTIIYEKE